MSIVDALVAAVRAGDPREARVAIRALAEVDDDRAREALGEALAGTGPLVELAIQALARHGARAQPIVVAAIFDPARKWSGVAAMGKLGDPAYCPPLRLLIDDSDPTVRLAVASALYRCGERDGKLWSSWICREEDPSVCALLSAVAGGGVTPTPDALDHLEVQADRATAPAEVRAGAVWAVAQHDVVRGTALAKRLLADPGAAFALSSVVRRRGGPLARLIIAIRGDPEMDQRANSIGLRHPTKR
ncbi:MAG TPA: hypothetical protein VHN14_14820 [Kofleriaceae bacterium]|nr:hypothetical protein [Kofleriaceae bacterium]